jgi:hypothetical protein
MQKFIITEQEKKKILEMYDIKTDEKVLNEALDYSVPIITSKNVGNNYYNINGFVSFPVTSSEMEPKEVTNAIDNIVKKLESEGYQATGLSVLNVNGGASNYLNGAMTADKIPYPNNPAILGPTENNLTNYPGKDNREKNLEYAKARGQVMKNALLKRFPPLQGAKISEPQAFIINTGGVIDENRDTKIYPVPGQIATFTAQLLVKPIQKPINIKEKFTQTKTRRQYTNQVGPEAGKGSICKILTQNTWFELLVPVQDIGLNPFHANIKIDDPKNGLYKIIKPGGGEFTKPEWIYIYWYLTNEANGYDCKSIENVSNLPSWLKNIDLTKVDFGAVNAEQEKVQDPSRHNLAK